MLTCVKNVIFCLLAVEVSTRLVGLEQFSRKMLLSRTLSGMTRRQQWWTRCVWRINLRILLLCSSCSFQQTSVKATASTIIASWILYCPWQGPCANICTQLHLSMNFAILNVSGYYSWHQVCDGVQGDNICWDMQLQNQRLQSRSATTSSYL